MGVDRAHQGKGKAGRVGIALNKYRNQPTAAHGKRHDSKKEARRWGDLLLLEKAGQITDLRHQPTFVLRGPDGSFLRYDSGRRATYRADSSYTENGLLVVEDVKSEATRTPVYKLKRAIMRSMGYDIREV